MRTVRPDNRTRLLTVLTVMGVVVSLAAFNSRTQCGVQDVASEASGATPGAQMNGMIDGTRRGLKREAMKFPRPNGRCNEGWLADSLRGNSNVMGGWVLALPWCFVPLGHIRPL